MAGDGIPHCARHEKGKSTTDPTAGYNTNKWATKRARLLLSTRQLCRVWRWEYSFKTLAAGNNERAQIRNFFFVFGVVHSIVYMP